MVVEKTVTSSKESRTHKNQAVALSGCRPTTPTVSSKVQQVGQPA